MISKISADVQLEVMNLDDMDLSEQQMKELQDEIS